MFERRLIFQEGGSSLGLLAWVALAVAAVLVLALTPRARRFKPWRYGLAGGLLVLAGVPILRSGVDVWTKVSIGAVLVAVLLIALLLQYERRLVRRSVGNTLLALRLLVLLTFALTLLRPALSWERNVERSGRILVAVDVSESMDTTDTHASQAEKLRWARALGMVGGGEVDARLDRWQEALDAGREPEWVTADEARSAEDRARIAEARRANFEALLASVDGVERKEIARRLLTEVETPLLPAFEELAEVQLVGFAGDATATDVAGLEKLLGEPPPSLRPGESDLLLGLTPVEAEAGKPLMGIVLLTDGRDTVGRDAVGLASRLGRAQAPVFPVMIGSEHRPKDLGIINLDYPQSSYPKDTRLLGVLIGAAGFKGRPVTVLLERDGAEPVEKIVTPEGDQAEVSFEIDEDALGRHEFTVRIQPEVGETRTDNNERRFALSIVDDQVRALLVEGEARWEFRYIHNAFIRDEGIGREHVKAVVFHQPYLGVLQDTWFPRRLDVANAAGGDEDDDESPLAELDLIVLGDVAPADMPAGAWEAIERFVAEGGGTLVLTAGKRHFPLEHRSPIVSRLLPITGLVAKDVPGRDPFGPPSERGFHLRLTPDGQDEAMLQFSTEGEPENQAVWRSLPGHTWGVFGEAKPQATVLAVADDGGRPLTLEDERRRGMIVQQYVGAGQVLWIGIDSTWRWRSRVGDAYHHRFWGQLARAAAAEKAAAGNDFVRFGLQKAELEAGEDAVFQARWARRFLRQHPDVRAKVLVRKHGAAAGADADADVKPFAEIELKESPSRSLLHEGRGVNLPPGEYTATLTAEGVDLGAEDDLTTSFYITRKPTRELADLSANRKLLAQLADVSGGRLFTPDTAAQLPELLTPPEFRSVERQEHELWDSWPMLLLFFSLLTAEWLVRKLNGLP